ncbi:ATP-binding protein [Herbiconiux sp.]|uniref:sensor histidine kinase n=1 Tax=Herbiconiux sp. TaxID=1871186 RepID=UPI0025B83EC5|nr:ATP-binding protein [Herbiconiux sp.]
MTEQRFRRIMVLCLGAASLAFAGVSSGALVVQSQHETPWWAVASIVIVFGSPIISAVAELAGLDHLARAALIFTTAGFLVVMLTLEQGLHGGALPASVGAPWILGITPLAAASAALALPPLGAWAYSLVIASLVAVDRILAFPGSIVDVALQDALVALLLQSVFAGLTLATLRASRSLDAVARAIRMEAIADARADARLREQRHADALIHDTVLATLLLAARGSSAHNDQAVALAQRGLEQIDRLGAPQAVDMAPPLDADELIWRVQAMATDLDPYARFTWAASGDLSVPSVVADTIVDAASEALRNSLQHAGRHEVSRAVVVDIRDAELHVAVLDDGEGFDPASVRPDRLGIRLSLEQRMAAVLGGSAVVSSRPGAGTSVVIRWRADAAG